MRKILAVARRDLKSGFRDQMILYILFIPLVIALVLRFLIPSTGENLMQVVLLTDTEPELIEHFEMYGKVEIVESREQMERRIGQKDDIFGVLFVNDALVIIEQGNEVDGTSTMVKAALASYTLPTWMDRVDVTISDIGETMSPMARYGASFLTVFVSVFGGMIVLMNFVEEKQDQTLAAIRVSTIRKSEYLIGKCMLGFLFPIIHAFLILLIMGFTQINFGQVALIVFAIAIIGVMAGLAIGLHSSDLISAASSMKLMFLPLFGSLFGGAFISEKYQWTLYWSPYYWAFRGMDAIVQKVATWPETLIYMLIILLLAGLLLLLLQKRIRRGMA